MKQLLFACILTLLVVIFAVQNADTVSVHFISWELNMSLALLLIITLVIGSLVGLLVATPRILRNKKELSLLKKQANNKNVLSSTSSTNLS